MRAVACERSSLACALPSLPLRAGLVNGTADVQWTSGFQSVYTPQLFGNMPILGTLGNHDYSILAANGTAWLYMHAAQTR